MTSTRYRVFASVTPGLESVIMAELRRIMGPRKLQKMEGGVEFWASQVQLWQVAQKAHCIESLRVRVGRFAANNFDQLQAGLSKVPWQAYLKPKSRIRIQTVCRKSALYHSDAVSERVEAVLAERLGCVRQDGAADPHDHLVALRIQRDRATVSIGAADRLHRRGWRLTPGRAPLRETLAAACLHLSKLVFSQTKLTQTTPVERIWDPFCGVGTMPIEGRQMALGHESQPKGQRFYFHDWPSFEAALPQSAETADADLPTWIASDLDPLMVEAACRHQAAAEVGDSIEFLTGDFETVGQSLSRRPTAVITNVPYGHRVGDRAEMAPLFRRFGRFLRANRWLNPVFVLNGNSGFISETNQKWDVVVGFQNRGLPVHLLKHR